MLNENQNLHREEQIVAFHVSRHPGGLAIGKLDLLKPWSSFNVPPHFLDRLSSGLEGGLSRHGEFYMIRPHPEPSPVSSIACEMFFEHIRQVHYPSAPSRLQCLFAVESLEDAMQMRATLSPNVAFQSEIYEVEPLGATLKANMALLSVGNPGGWSLINAHAYWSGEVGHSPCTWETLLHGSVNVIRKVLIDSTPQAHPASPFSGHR